MSGPGCADTRSTLHIYVTSKHSANLHCLEAWPRSDQKDIVGERINFKHTYTNKIKVFGHEWNWLLFLIAFTSEFSVTVCEIATKAVLEIKCQAGAYLSDFKWNNAFTQHKHKLNTPHGHAAAAYRERKKRLCATLTHSQDISTN